MREAVVTAENKIVSPPKAVVIAKGGCHRHVLASFCRRYALLVATMAFQIHIFPVPMALAEAIIINDHLRNKLGHITRFKYLDEAVPPCHTDIAEGAPGARCAS